MTCVMGNPKQGLDYPSQHPSNRNILKLSNKIGYIGVKWEKMRKEEWREGGREGEKVRFKKSSRAILINSSSSHIFILGFMACLQHSQVTTTKP